jgi:hypothetical protein
MECSLGKGELMRLSGSERGLLLHCLSGTIWLTTGDGRDYLVLQGKSFQLQEGASALAEALDSGRIRLEPYPGYGVDRPSARVPALRLAIP